MKKALSLLLVLLLCLSVCACNTSGSNDAEANNKHTSADSTLFDEEQAQKLIDYNKALELLDSLSEVDKMLCDEDIEIMGNAYSILLSLGDYKDSPELLSRFTECTCQAYNSLRKFYNNQGDLIAITVGLHGFVFNCATQYDATGKISRIDYTSPIGAEYYETYQYSTDDYSAIRYKSGAEIWYDGVGTTWTETTYHCKYNENWQIVEEQSEVYESTALSTFAYDDSGCLISETACFYETTSNKEINSNKYDVTYSTVYLYMPPKT